MAVLPAEPAVVTPYGASLALTPASTAAARPASRSLLICCSRQLFGVCWFAAAWKSWRTCDGQEASVLSTVQRSTDSRFQVRCSWATSTDICSHGITMTKVQTRKLGKPCATRQSFEHDLRGVPHQCYYSGLLASCTRRCLNVINSLVSTTRAAVLQGGRSA